MVSVRHITVLVAALTLKYEHTSASTVSVQSGQTREPASMKISLSFSTASEEIISSGVALNIFGAILLQVAPCTSFHSAHRSPEKRYRFLWND